VTYRAGIFDIDGTLVASNDAHARAWVDALAAGGRHVELSRVRPLIGMGSDKLLPQLGIDPESPEAKAAAERRGEIFKRHYLPRIQPTRGAHELVATLYDKGLTLVIATSAEKNEVDALLRIADVGRFFTAKTSSEDAERSKPDPDIVCAALRETDCSAGHVVMLGDTPYDVAAARGAGVEIIALRSGGWSGADLAGAIAVYDDPQDLLDHLAASPFARGIDARSA
jgi:phosphoglycolate phosphatase-like HAD superfamily hydrolase